MPSHSADRFAGTFDELFDAHAQALLAYARRRTTNLDEAEDAVAQSFTIAWRKLTDAPVEPLPWLLAICRRVLANQRRATARRAGLLARLAAASTRVQPIHSARTPALDALAKLKPDDQELLRLVAWEDLDHASIAVALGISVNAVAIRLHRARDRFRRAMTETTAGPLKDSGDGPDITRVAAETARSFERDA